MKKILSGISLIILCAFFTVTAFAADTNSGVPSVEFMSIYYKVNSDDGYSPLIYFRNNSGKSIQYADWYITLYNSAGNPIPDQVTGSPTVKLRSYGPFEPDSYVVDSLPNSGYISTGYSIISGYTENPQIGLDRSGFLLDTIKSSIVYIDKYGNYFIMPRTNNRGRMDYSSRIYLTKEEVENKLFYQYTNFGVSWYSSVFSYSKLEKVELTYMDGTTETVSGILAEGKRQNPGLTNKEYLEQLEDYKSIYNYSDYKKYNSDLANQFGNDEYKYFEHFLSSGMKEGRQACRSFNLSVYKVNNPDLVAVFGDDNVKYYMHYLSTGKKEGRIAK